MFIFSKKITLLWLFLQNQQISSTLFVTHKVYLPLYFRFDGISCIGWTTYPSLHRKLLREAQNWLCLFLECNEACLWLLGELCEPCCELLMNVSEMVYSWRLSLKQNNTSSYTFVRKRIEILGSGKILGKLNMKVL